MILRSGRRRHAKQTIDFARDLWPYQSAAAARLQAADLLIGNSHVVATPCLAAPAAWRGCFSTVLDAVEGHVDAEERV